MKRKVPRARKASGATLLCANCQTELIGAYCYACGQRAHLHYQLKDLLEEFAEGIVHFDGRIWRTLPMLALDPGRLSREWIAGRRNRYIAPLHLFLFTVFLLFLIPNFTGRHVFDLGQSPAEKSGDAAAFTIRHPDGTKSAVDPNDVGALKKTLGLPAPLVGLVQLGVKLRNNPQYYAYKFEALAYKLSFLAVPISVLILWLLYAWRRDFSLYQHVVVSLYGLAFVAALLAIAAVFPTPISEVLYLLIVFIAPIHAALHLRGAYGGSWLGVLVRTAWLTVLTFLGFTGFLLGVVFLGLTS